MIRVTAFVHLRSGTDPAAIERLVEAVRRADEELDVVAVDAAGTTPNSHRAGDVMLLAAFADDDAAQRAARDPYVESVVRPLLGECATHVETVRYAQGPTELRDPGLERGIHRTLLLHVDPATASSAVERFERDLRDMPRYIETIRNSSLSRVGAMHRSRGPDYTHVWEQEFTDLDGLTGAYMMHGYHWSLVDPWFDAQSPEHIVHPTLIHAAAPLRRSILARASTSLTAPSSSGTRAPS